MTYSQLNELLSLSKVGSGYVLLFYCAVKGSVVSSTRLVSVVTEAGCL